MAKKTKFEEFISDMKSITQIPMFGLSPAKKTEREDGDVKKDENVKTKLLEAWNNIRYDLGPIATLKKDIPIWILGVCHHSRSVNDLASVEAEEEDDVFDTPLDRRIYTDFASRPRFTYRKNFPPISGTDITTDTGWGCMLRSVQMMIAQGLLLHFLGRDWRWLTSAQPTRREKNLHKEIIGWFIDDPSCPLSIHRLSEIGRKFGNMPGNWYGPNTVAHIMQNAVKEAKEKHAKLKQIAVYVAVDCTVYSEDVYDLCDWRNSMKTDKKLGSKSPNRIYSSTSSGSLKLSTHDVFTTSEASSPFSPYAVFSIEPTVHNAYTNLTENKNPPTNFDTNVRSTHLELSGKSNTQPSPSSQESHERTKKSASDDATTIDNSNRPTQTSPTCQKSCELTGKLTTDDATTIDKSNTQPSSTSQKSCERAGNSAADDAVIIDKSDTRPPLKVTSKKSSNPDEEERLRLESWCEVPEILSSESYENFQKYSEKKKQPHKFSFSMTKKKKEKISLYKDNGEKDDSQLNGRIIIPHFQVDSRKRVQTQKSHEDDASKNFNMPPCTSKLSDEAPKNKAVRQKIKTDNYVKKSKGEHVVVTPETPSPILFRRTNSKTGESEILRSPDILLSKLSVFKWDERSRVDDSQDDFLSSHLEPVIPNQKTCDANPSVMSKSRAKNEFCQPPMQAVSKTGISKNSGEKSRLQTFEIDANSPECGHSISSPVRFEMSHETADENFKLRNMTDLSPMSPGKMSDPQPIPVGRSNTRETSKLLRRSSSTPDFRLRSSTTGESPHTPRGSQKFLRKRSLPSNKTRHHKAVLILIPVRLGESALNPIYAPCVEAMLSLGSSIGIIGGKPKHSLYFVGCQGQGLLHLDPHYCQPADTPAGYAKNLHDYHTTQIRKVNVKKIDPSCCLGFYCRTPEEFEEFKIQSQKNFTPPQQSFSYPMCLIMDGRSGDNEIKTAAMSHQEHDLSKNTSLPLASFDMGVDVGDNSPIRTKNLVTVDKQGSDAVSLKKKKKMEVFSMDEMSSTLNKLNPLAKLMRKSPIGRRKYPSEHEELESQFELL